MTQSSTISIDNDLDRLQLQQLIESHQLWLHDRQKGQRLVLRGKRLLGSNFAQLDLRAADFSGAILSASSFSGAILSGASFNEADATDTDFSGAILEEAKMSAAKFGKARLHGAVLDGATAIDTDFTEISGHSLRARDARMPGARFKLATLPRADFASTDLAHADFYDADLVGACFQNAWLHRASFDGADLCFVVGNGAHIRTIQIPYNTITYTSSHMSVGCHTASFDDWWRYTPQDIARLVDRPDQVDLWEKIKPILQALVTAMPARL
jgi:uncharacterized protein YjbI with pentapeptide repeats